MDFIQLRTVMEIHNAGSLSRASMRLNKPQSFLSRHLAAFEKECGGRIFYRNGRGVVPTELGEQILPEIESVLKAMERMVDFRTAAENAIAGDVKVYVTSAICTAFLSDLFIEVTKAFPLVRLQFAEGYSWEIDSAFEDGATDIAVLLRNGCTVGPRDEAICQYDTFLVGLPGDPLLERQEIHFSELEGLPLLMPSEPSLARYAIGNLAASKGIPLSIAAEVNSPSSTQALLQSGAGYLIAPVGCGPAAATGYLGQQIREGRLQAARLCDPVLERTLVVSANPGKGERVEMVRKIAIGVLRNLMLDKGQEPERRFGT